MDILGCGSILNDCICLIFWNWIVCSSWMIGSLWVCTERCCLCTLYFLSMITMIFILNLFTSFVKILYFWLMICMNICQNQQNLWQQQLRQYWPTSQWKEAILSIMKVCKVSKEMWRLKLYNFLKVSEMFKIDYTTM